MRETRVRSNFRSLFGPAQMHDRCYRLTFKRAPLSSLCRQRDFRTLHHIPRRDAYPAWLRQATFIMIVISVSAALQNSVPRISALYF